MGEHGFFTVVPAVAVHIEPVGAKQSRWNADGELLASNNITGARQGGWGRGTTSSRFGSQRRAGGQQALARRCGDSTFRPLLPTPPRLASLLPCLISRPRS